MFLFSVNENQNLHPRKWTLTLNNYFSATSGEKGLPATKSQKGQSRKNGFPR